MDSTEDKDNVPEAQRNLIDLDLILEEEVGQFGRYQMMTTACISLIIIFYSLTTNEYNFTAAQIPHRCRIPECDGSPNDVPNPEYSPSWLLNAINGTTLHTFENCTRFANTTSGPSASGSCPAEWFNRTSVVDCNEYVYENTMGAVYDFDLGCNERRRTILNSYTDQASCMMLPMISGLGDSRGRRPVLIISVFIASCFGFVRSFMTSYVAFLILRIIQFGFGCSAFGLCYILGIELVGPNYRATVGAILSTMIPLGQIILGLIAWGVTWRTLLLIIFTPQLLIISYFWIIPESVRWLLCKEKYTQSEAIIRKIARVNKKELSDTTINDFHMSATTVKNEYKGPSFLRLILKSPVIIRRMAMGLLWFVTYSSLQYTMDQKTVYLTQHHYLNYVYVTSFAIPGIWTAAFLLDRIGRKKVIIGSYLLCAACQLAFAFIPQDWSVLFTVVYLLGKYFLGAVTSSMNLYTVELYPTEFRALLFSYFYLHTILGVLIAPLIASLGPISWMGLPSVLFCCLALISGLLVIFAPETRGTKLPDTMEEAVQLGNDEKTHIPLASVEN